MLDGKWCDIDLENRLWDIPKECMKKCRPHIEPLSEQVVAMLTELKGITSNDEILFTTRSTNPKNRLVYRKIETRLKTFYISL